MKTKLKLRFLLLVLLSASTLANAQGTAFTYQGRLNSGTNPASGTYDLTFALFSVSSGAGQVGGTLTSTATPVSNGLFTVTLDFGNQFPGADRWLEIAVRTNGGGAFTNLSPRQHITATPYAVTAGTVTGAIPESQLSTNVAKLNTPNTTATATALAIITSGFITGTTVTSGGSGYTVVPGVNVTAPAGSGAVLTANVSGGQVTSLNVVNAGSGYTSGATITIGAPPSNAFQTFPGTNFFTNPGNTFVGNGSGLTSVNAATLGGLSSASFWKTNGNAGANPTNGAFLGTTDNLPLEFKVNGQRALRIEYATNEYGIIPNIVGGFSGNIISNGFVGAVIGGGGYFIPPFVFYPNRAGNDFATVVGGAGNTASGLASTAMGLSTTASGPASTAMGSDTAAIGYNSTAMGNNTTASGNYSTAMGGGSTASGESSTAMGSSAKALHDGSFVWADQGSDFASTAANQFCIRARGGVQLSGGTSIDFGTTTRQMLNCYGLGFGVGVQTATLYSRANTRFSWFKGGVHSDVENNPGAGGTVLMTLTSTSLTVNGTFVSASDRNVKENFTPVRPREVLEKVVALPLSSWNFKADTSTRHVGPMAQDFYAAFNVGPDDKHIATVDADGVALAAIQGLNEKLETGSQKSEVRIQKLETENTELKQRLEKLEQLLNHNNRGAK